MQNIGKKSFSFLFIGVFILFGAVNIISVKALDNGIYTAVCTPYYVHPVTGVVEDSGGIDSLGIGQPMTDSATHTEALIEVDPDGNTFATVRIKLMDNIEDISFKVQEDGNSEFYDVDYDIVQENLDDNTTDFRMQIPNENSYLRATFYVVPMGRYVIYYIGFSELQSGSGDFITNVEVVEPEELEGPIEEEPIENEFTETSSTEEQTEAASVSSTKNESQVNKNENSSAVNSAKNETSSTSSDKKDDVSSRESSSKAEATESETASDTAVDTNDTMPVIAVNDKDYGNGVIIYDENGNLMQLSDIVQGTVEIEKNNSQSNNLAVKIVICCGAAAAVGAIVISVVRAVRRRGNK